jgi:hypothetical protein
MDSQELRDFIRDVIEEEFGPKPIEIGPRWAGGTLILKPANDSQAKDIPLDIFWKKIISMRENLRVLEQKINTHPTLSQEDKVSLQSYVTKSYGTLTSFNILFKDDKHKFVGSGTGSGGSDKGKDPKLSYSEAKKRLGLNEYE